MEQSHRWTLLLPGRPPIVCDHAVLQANRHWSVISRLLSVEFYAFLSLLGRGGLGQTDHRSYAVDQSAQWSTVSFVVDKPRPSTAFFPGASTKPAPHSAMGKSLVWQVWLARGPPAPSLPPPFALFYPSILALEGPESPIATWWARITRRTHERVQVRVVGTTMTGVRDASARPCKPPSTHCSDPPLPASLRSAVVGWCNGIPAFDASLSNQ